jgi:hypothetical protein
MKPALSVAMFGSHAVSGRAPMKQNSPALASVVVAPSGRWVMVTDSRR